MIELDSHDAGSYRQAGWIELSLPNAAEDGIELGIADVEVLMRRWPPSCRWRVEENI